MTQHPALKAGNVAVITGGADGIGLAAARYYKSIGMDVCLADINPEKLDSAWTSEQVIIFMAESLANGDFYILCPDNDVTREQDNRRMAWAMGDLIENRPALSRWHADFKDEFERFTQE